MYAPIAYDGSHTEFMRDGRAFYTFVYVLVRRVFKCPGRLGSAGFPPRALLPAYRGPVLRLLLTRDASSGWKASGARAGAASGSSTCGR